MQKNKKVSICVPIYNTEKYIKRCVISLFEQTYPNLEFIFVDDKTPDKSINILKELILSYHKEAETILISHKQNRGLAAARNSAVAKSTGDFLMHVDSDDYLEKNAIELAIKKQQETNADIINFGFITTYPHSKIITLPPTFASAKEMCLKQIARSVNINLWGRLYKTELYKKNHITAKEGVDMGEDYQVTPILTYYAKKVSSLQVPLYHYNCLNQHSYCSTFSSQKRNQIEESVNLLMSFFKDKPEFNEAINLGLLDIYITFAKEYTRSFSAENKREFKKNINNISKLNKKYWNKINIKDRLILTIKCYYVAYIYINLMRFLKHTLNKYIL